METNTTNRRYSVKGMRGSAQQRGLRTPRKGASQETQQRAFLNHRFEPLPIRIAPMLCGMGRAVESGGKSLWKFDNGTEIDLSASREDLAGAAFAYALANGRHLEWESKGVALEDIRSLYSAVRGVCPKENEVNIDFDPTTGKLYFRESVNTDFPDDKCFWLPVGFLQHLDLEERELMGSFLKFTARNAGFCWPDEHMDFAYVLGYMGEEEWFDDNCSCEEFKGYKRSYRGGFIYDLLTEVKESDEQFYHEAFGVLAEESKIPELGDLLHCASEGYKLMEGNSIQYYRHNVNECNIIDFSDDEDYGEYNLLERLLCLCYRTGDPIAEQALECINGDSWNVEMERLYTERVLTTNTDTPLVANEFPMRWARWFSEFVDKIESYEQVIENARERIPA